MGQLDASIVTLAFPALATDFHTSLAAVQWVSLAYLLTLIALLAAAGRIADAVGRKQVYLYGFVVFTGASAACGFAPSLGALIAFRAVQAVGAAMMQSNSVALVSTSVPRDRIRTALGVQAAAQALGLALGPTLGGIIVSDLGWRWIFGINLPIGAVALVAGYFLLPRTRTRSSAHIDGPGIVLLAATTTPALIGVSAASGLRLPLAAVLGLFAVAALAGVCFWQWEQRAAAPLIDPAAIANPLVRRGLLGALGGYLILFGPLVLVPIVLTGHGYSELRAGLLLTALPAGFGLSAGFGNSVLPHQWSDSLRSVVGVLVTTAALIALIILPITGPGLVPLLALMGIGLGIFTPANNAMIMANVPERSAGVGGGLVNLSRGLGTALGVALTTLALHQAGSAGSRVALGILAVAAVLTAVVSGRR
jgi:EmrB/QacA subfamily drug resistance transporter